MGQFFKEKRGKDPKRPKRLISFSKGEEGKEFFSGRGAPGWRNGGMGLFQEAECGMRLKFPAVCGMKRCDFWRNGGMAQKGPSGMPELSKNSRRNGGMTTPGNPPSHFALLKLTYFFLSFYFFSNEITRRPFFGSPLTL